MTILVTGAAGFIGSNFLVNWHEENDETSISIDKLSYAGNLANLGLLEGKPNHIFVKGSILDIPLISNTISKHQPRAIPHANHHGIRL